MLCKSSSPLIGWFDKAVACCSDLCAMPTPGSGLRRTQFCSLCLSHGRVVVADHPLLNPGKTRWERLPCRDQKCEQMATPALAESGRSPVDGWLTSTVPTFTSCMSLPLLMHPWQTKWGDGHHHFSELSGL